MISQSSVGIRGGYWTLLAACGALAFGSLVLDVLAPGSRSEPLGQVVLDGAFSVLNLLLALALLCCGERSWVRLLLALALTASASVFTLQADTAELMMPAVGPTIAGWLTVALRGLTGAAYLLALVLFPTGGWDLEASERPRRPLVVLTGSALLGVIGLGATLLPDAISSVVFFGFLIPLVGLLALPRRIRRAARAEHRTQARLLVSVLATALSASAVLSTIALLLWALNEPGGTLADPSGQLTGPLQQAPIAPPFWFSRLAAAAIAGAVLIATRRHRLWRVEQLFSRSLAATLVIVFAGCGYVVTQAVTARLTGNQTAGAAVASALVAVALLPLYGQLQRLVDQLLYGRRPTPYRVLADITALSRSAPADTPDLAGVAEAIGRGLGASSCRLTVKHTGLRDRTYAWSAGTAAADDDHVVLPIQLGGEHIGAIALDRAAVAGLHAQRRHLLADIAEHLGTILQVHQLGIELEKQLRAALAHAEDIALSRRAAVAEMDSERRSIERNLHDGAQHHLVSLRLAVGLVEHDVERGHLEAARSRLDQLTTQIDTAEAVLAETATGVCSILLSQRGLLTALRTDLSGGHPPVVITTHGIPADRRFPPQVEAAVYFCCLEAVNNARKHAPGASVTVQVLEVDGALRFTIRDDGPGFISDGAGTGHGAGGRGLRNVAARIAAVGGTISIQSVPGVGTTLDGALPLRPRVQPTAAEGDHVPADARGISPVNGPVNGQPPILDQVREVLREALTLYAGSAQSGRLGELQAQLDEPPPGGTADRAVRSGNAHRAGALKARSALRVLDAVVRSAPLHGDRALRLRYQLERIRSGAHELAEIDLINELRSGTLPLTGPERHAAEELLGAAGAEPSARLGLPADADADALRQAAQRQLDHWQRRASHPGVTRAVRDAAEVLVQTCEELLTHASPQ
ncbi:MAG: histidine kinase [Pseudonocardiales bacterium]|nr:histidine kinase [Pseudonocardiales bacterium]